MRLIFSGIESKDELLKIGEAVILEFCNINNIKFPNIYIQKTMPGTFDHNLYGYYKYSYNKRKKFIMLNINNLKIPTRNPGYSWSYPGYVIDATPFGILCHEFGHYITCHNKKLRKDFSFIKNLEAPVSSREYNLDERMAEAVRLFLTNPQLLKKGRPKRYKILSDYFNPVITSRWKTVLKNADLKFITATENWINKNNIYL